ncbi:MAG: DUF3107 domain-containing protein [Actinomycetota bacterium]|jgi:hypothetical protein|nr:DUF3107 domain-containing protein [Actinomycetota bacterium]
MDIRIGIMQTPKELEVEVGDDTDQARVVKDIEKALGDPDGVLWLTDRKGRKIAVQVAKIAYVEVMPSGEERRVGFGIL